MAKRRKDPTPQQINHLKEKIRQKWSDEDFLERARRSVVYKILYGVDWKSRVKPPEAEGD